MCWYRWKGHIWGRTDLQSSVEERGSATRHQPQLFSRHQRTRNRTAHVRTAEKYCACLCSVFVLSLCNTLLPSAGLKRSFRSRLMTSACTLRSPSCWPTACFVWPHAASSKSSSRMCSSFRYGFSWKPLEQISTKRLPIASEPKDSEVILLRNVLVCSFCICSDSQPY